MEPSSPSSDCSVVARSHALRGCAVMVGMAVVVGVQAQAPAGAYPNRPVRLVVPYAPGGNIDITGRIVAPAMSDALGVSFVVATAANSGPSIRFNRMGGYCNPGVGTCPATFANPCGTDAGRCTINAGSNFFAPQADGTLVLTLREQNTNLVRTVSIAPGGRVLPQP